MKAQFVYENLGFQRNMDPRDAMNVGFAFKRFAKLNGYEYLEEYGRGKSSDMLYQRIRIPIESAIKTGRESPQIVKNQFGRDLVPVAQLQYQINHPKGWESSDTPISLRIKWLMDDGQYIDQRLLGRFADEAEAVHALKKNLANEQKRAEKSKS